jgi:hypothetical protein
MKIATIRTQGALKIATNPPTSAARRAASARAGELRVRDSKLPCTKRSTPKTTAARAISDAFIDFPPKRDYTFAEI